MATIDLINVFYWGADKITITEGDGSVAPQVSAAVALSRNQIKVTFDRAMSFHFTLSEVLKARNYFIEDDLFSRRLYVLNVQRLSDTEVLLTTQDTEPIGYTVTVSNAQDAFGAPVEAPNNTASFTGINPADEYPVATKVYSFWGLYGGLETSEEPAITPDADPPYLTNLDPLSGAGQVSKTKLVKFDINDDGLGVELTLVKVFVNGALAYNGATNTFIAPYNGASSLVDFTGSPAVLKFTINRTSDWPSYTDISIRVIAGDKTPIANYLDTTYSFKIEDYEVPILLFPFPTGTGVSKSTNIGFTLADVAGSGVDAATINVLVNGSPAIVDGAFQTGYDGPGSQIIANVPQNGFDVTIDRTTDYTTYGLVVVGVTFDDNEGRQGSYNWNFRVEDYLGPLVSPVAPLNGEEGVSLSQSIQVQISDEQDIQSGTTLIEIDVGGGGFQVAYEDGGSPEFKPGWNGPASQVVSGAGVKNITIDPVATFPFATVVTVRVTSLDVEGNPERLS